MNKKRRPRKLETRITIGIFLTLFSAMIIYLCIYVHNNEQVLMSNSYNSRQKILAKENLRGSIYDKYGEVLAYSESNGSTDERIQLWILSCSKLPATHSVCSREL